MSFNYHRWTGEDYLLEEKIGARNLRKPLQTKVRQQKSVARRSARVAELASSLDPFYYDTPAIFAKEAPSTPAPSYLMHRDLAADPTPYLLYTGVKLRIIFHGGHEGAV